MRYHKAVKVTFLGTHLRHHKVCKVTFFEGTDKVPDKVPVHQVLPTSGMQRAQTFCQFILGVSLVLCARSRGT